VATTGGGAGTTAGETTVTTEQNSTETTTDDGTERLVVGADGSPPSRAALVWGLRAAAEGRARVEVLSAYPVDFYWTDPFLADTRRMDHIRTDTEKRVRDFVDEVRRDPAVADVPGVADVAVDVVVVAGAPAPHLVGRARGARTLVVGSRGRGAVRSALLGSVALHCVTHAPCPVVVVHDAVPRTPARVVVGLDDAEASRDVLARAAREAERLGAEIEAVAVCPAPEYWGYTYDMIATLSAELDEGARTMAQSLVDEVLPSDRRGTVHVSEGSPGEILVARAEGAALLVVGSRSRSTLRGTVLGSVALYCAMHAPCPVMVVHPGQGAGADVPADRSAAPVRA
jgi:nucleotide-binding universal stress UspA family protein